MANSSDQDAERLKLAEEIAALADKEWRELVDPLAPIGKRLIAQLMDPQNPLLRQELYRATFSQIAMGYLGMTFADKDHPDFWPYFTSAFNWLGPNPDDDYYITPIDEAGTYRLSGYRGTVRRVDFQFGNGQFVPKGIVDDQYLGATLANYNLDDLPLRADGYFDVLLSQARPEGHEGSWLLLPPKTTYLMLRQISYDWVNEADGRFAIERVDTPAVKPRETAEQLAEKLKHIAYWTESLVKVSSDFIGGVRKQGLINKLGYKDLSDAGGIITQRYVYGMFELEADEALIIEARVPQDSRYWSIHLTDDLFFTLDWVHRLTIVNGFTAKVDKDGMLRVVVSAQDPGVPNWLDNAGYKRGAIQGRWEECSNWPDHVTTKVKTVDVRRHLPPETPKVSPEERDAAIRLNRRGAQMRKRW